MAKPTVGILSMQRVINYGSFLQAYALRELLKMHGAGEVYFVDIIPGRILVDNPVAKKNRWTRYWIRLRELKASGMLISGLKTFIFFRKVERSIKKAWPELKIGEHPDKPYDLVVIGSDEVFNCTQDVKWGYSRQLFGDIPYSVARKIFSYAGSFGYTDLDKLKKYKIDSEIGENLKKISAISVRDENSASIVESLTGISPAIHIDPVLAYGYQEEIESFTTSPYTKPYMIVYSYQDRINDKNEIDAICNYARQNKLLLISIFCRYDWCDKDVVPRHPIEVLRWFKYAKCVITDTFHGTIFSIITKSNFATLIRPSNLNKLSYMLETFALGNRETTSALMEKTLSTHPDFSECNSILDTKRHETKQYISRILEK
ncbi:MAG: polysaccharide pyruvyl transferase family protein [Muribaculaceae bacterium]|nr:polysaccharide pyruvyl transferase family protein [Muribaculaceae bacterium]